MKKRIPLQALALTCCVGLAACGGLSTRYANGSGPATYSGPVDVAVVGPSNDGIAPDAVLAATSVAFRNLGLRTGETTVAADIGSISRRVMVADASSSGRMSDPLRARDLMAGPAIGSGSNSRVIVLHGPIAADLANAPDRKWADALCATGTGPQAGSAAATGSGTPAAVVLCSGGAFQSTVYQTFATGTPGESVPPALMANLVERAFTGDVTD
jgi:hypothetical protein